MAVLNVVLIVAIWSGWDLPGTTPRSEPEQVQFLACKSRLQWLDERLDQTDIQSIIEAASEEGIDPVRALVLIANELSDYGFIDQVQEYLNIGRTFGLIQMQVATVIRHDLLEPQERSYPDRVNKSDSTSVASHEESDIIGKIRNVDSAATLLAREIHYLQQQLTQGVGFSAYSDYFYLRTNNEIEPKQRIPVLSHYPGVPMPNMNSLKQTTIDSAIAGAYQSDLILGTRNKIDNLYNPHAQNFKAARIQAFYSIPWSLCLRSETGAKWLKIF